MRLRNTERGFTLIELLIVIVIIGILSGLLIGLINPARQQARSRNATIQSAISKVAYGVNAARSATGSLPTAATLDDELENIEVHDAYCTGSTCNFTIPGIRLPATCDNSGATSAAYGTGTDDCEFRYVADTAPNSNVFTVIAKRWPLSSDEAAHAYYYHSTQGLYDCLLTAVADGTVTADELSSDCTLAAN